MDVYRKQSEKLKSRIGISPIYLAVREKNMRKHNCHENVGKMIRLQVWIIPGEMLFNGCENGSATYLMCM